MLKLAAIIIVLTFTSTSCLPLDRGTNTFIKQSSNKRGDKKAILFLKEAGATVPDSYQVIVCDIDHALDKSEVGNAFTVDTNHGATFLNTASINFTWIGNDTLLVDYDKNLRTFIQEKKVDEVTIIYKPR
ncbi:MAG TPA: hypothetical protein VFP87_13275 [Chitinophagaceae bacterium]|nr:hypothetical protein [Chitinophagaceae bacterium]